jgi:hypothetical protein
MGKYRELGTGLDRVFRNNLNDNFDDIGVDVDDLQTQINTLVVSGDSSVEAAQARVEADGTTNATLKARLDKKEAEFESQLAQRANQVDLTALNTQLTYATTKNPYIVIEGDSTAKGGTSGASMALWLSMMLKREITNNAVWGSWTAQVKARLKENVLDLHPKYCLLLMGTNDIYGGENRKTSLDNYEYILDTLITNEIEPIVLSVLPRNDFPAKNADIRIFNSCLLYMCQEKNIKFVDLYNPLAKSDGTALDYILHNADNLHWSTYGGVLGAREVLKAFDVPKQNNEGYPHNLFKGEYPLVENGIFAGANTSGLGINWTALNTANTTFSQEVNPNGGNFQVINKTSSTAITSGISQTIGAFSENATYRFQSEIEFILTDRTDGGNNNALTYISLEFLNSGGSSIGSVLVDEIWYSAGIPLTQVYKDFTPPAGTATTRLTLCANATSPFTLKVGRTYANIIR